jgi:hypothetical protein
MAHTCGSSPVMAHWLAQIHQCADRPGPVQVQSYFFRVMALSVDQHPCMKVDGVMGWMRDSYGEMTEIYKIHMFFLIIFLYGCNLKVDHGKLVFS